MKIFHLSDLHIGLKLFHYDLSQDQRHIFSQIAEAAAREEPDAIVIAGDIYDKAVPSAEAVSLFDEFIRSLARSAPGAAIMMVSGNHDSGARLDVFRSILARQRVYMVGLPPAGAKDHIEKVTLYDSFGPVNFYLLPFVRPSMVRQVLAGGEDVSRAAGGPGTAGGEFAGGDVLEGEGGAEAGMAPAACVLEEEGATAPSLSYDEALHRLLAREKIDRSARNVLVSHQFYVPAGEEASSVERMDSEVCTVGNIDAVRADILAPFDYAALGHIHKPMRVGGDAWRYCGTPLACSVSEAGQEKGILVVELGEKKEGCAAIRAIPLRPLRQVRVLRGDLLDILARPSDDYVSVCLTDRADLDVLDMQDRLRQAFPHLLEIRREAVRGADYGRAAPARAAQADPYDLCCAFLPDADEEDKSLLRDVINAVRAM